MCGAPRLVLLYATCTVNKHYLQPYNEAIPFTPHLAQFARSSVVFERHQTEAGLSGIAYASIFTGSQADRHGVYRHPGRLASDLHLITEAFAEAGYETFFWNAHHLAGPRLGYGQGVSADNTHSARLMGGRVFEQVLRRVRKDPDYRAFVVTNFTATHAPYRQDRVEKLLEEYPEEGTGITAEELGRLGKLYVDNRFQLEWNFPETVERLKLSPDGVASLARVVELLYKANVHHLDGMFGRLLDQIGRSGVLDESLVVFTADHGETLYRDNALFKWSHGQQLAQEVLGVPWIVRAPTAGLEPGRYEEVTRSIDLFPSVLGLSGLGGSIPSGVDGVDLAPALLGLEAPPHLLAFSHTSIVPRDVVPMIPDLTLLGRFYPRADPDLIWVSVRDRDMIYRHRNLDGVEWGFEVFDLQSDPLTTTNLYDPALASHRAMTRELGAYRARLIENYVEDPEADDPERRREDLESMRDLGYVN